MKIRTRKLTDTQTCDSEQFEKELKGYFTDEQFEMRDECLTSYKTLYDKYYSQYETQILNAQTSLIEEELYHQIDVLIQSNIREVCQPLEILFLLQIKVQGDSCAQQVK